MLRAGIDEHLDIRPFRLDGLDIGERRLLTMGVLAATRRFDILQKQFSRTLQTGEMTPDKIREVVLHLIPYVGTPSSGDLWAAATNAIDEHDAAPE